EIGSELLRKATNRQKSLTPVKRAGGARAEDRTGAQIVGPQRFAVTALAGDATKEITIARTVDARLLLWVLPTAQHQRSNGRHGCIAESTQRRFRPGCCHFGVIVEQLDNR